jgi:DNA topoisomerase-3
MHRSQYNPIWEFCYTINGQQCDMVFTSVAGHLMELEFAAQYKRWRGCSPLELYTAPVVKDVPAVSTDLLLCCSNTASMHDAACSVCFKSPGH